jgi:hypothetical protein
MINSITDEEQRQQTFKVTQLLAQECAPIPEENNFALFAVDCTANPRIFSNKYDIEHFFRFGKQRLGLVSSQTPETFHEENWHWIGLLAYNMLYHTRTLARSVRYPWERKEVQMLTSVKRPSQVQRDYERIIRGIGTPAPVPKPRGKSPGRRQGEKGKRRPDRLLVRKSAKEDGESSNKLQTSRKKRVLKPKLSHIRRIWPKNRPAPMRC